MRKTFFYLSLFIFSWVYSVFFNNIDWDLWARLSVGKMFFQLGSVLKNDIFSYTPTKFMWVDHEWGSGVVFYFIANHFGDAGLLLLKVLGFFSILVLVSKIIELNNLKFNQHLNLFLYLVMILAIFNGVGGTVRCQLFTFLFFTLWIYVLERVRRGENRLLWIMPATMLVWANLHGGFVSGLGLLAIYGVGEFLNKKPFAKYFLIIIPSLLVTLINPYGFKYWEFILHATTMPRPTITEWAPTQMFGPFGKWKGFKILFLISVISFAFSFLKNRPKYKDIDKVKYLLLVVTAYLSLKHIKHQSFFVIVSVCFLYHDFYGIFTMMRDYIVEKFGDISDKVINKLFLVKEFFQYSAIIVLGCLLIYADPVKIAVSSYLFPAGSFEFIKQNKLSGNLITVFHWGSYAAWKLYPQCLIAVDGRYEEVYPDNIHEMTYNFIYQQNRNWYDFIKKYHTDILVLEKKNDSYLGILKSKDWKLVFDDKISGVFLPAGKAKPKGSYIIPDYNDDYYGEEKYNTSINFLD